MVAARALLDARAAAEEAHAEVERIADAMLEARANLGNAEAAQEAAADRSASFLIQSRADKGDGTVWLMEVARCQGVINRLERLLGQATQKHSDARAALHNADQQHAGAAMRVLAGEAEALAHDLASSEARSAALWRSLDTFSRLWLAGAGAGPPKLGPVTVQVLQYPPRLARVNLAPPAAAAITAAIAAEWRAKFEALLAEAPAEAEEVAA